MKQYTKSFRFILFLEDELYHEFTVKDGKLISFVVQYQTKINNRMETILRIDTEHGYAHKHIFHLKKKRHDQVFFISDNTEDYSKIYNEELNYIKNNFEKIKENFLN